MFFLQKQNHCRLLKFTKRLKLQIYKSLKKRNLSFKIILKINQFISFKQKRSFLQKMRMSIKIKTFKNYQNRSSLKRLNETKVLIRLIFKETFNQQFQNRLKTNEKHKSLIMNTECQLSQIECLSKGLISIFQNQL